MNNENLAMRQSDSCEQTTHRTFLLWDAELPPKRGDWTVVLWRSYGDSRAINEISIPNLVEKKSDKLKNGLLAWLYSLGESYFDEKRLVDHLELRDGLSYWWMTLLAEKSYAKTIRFYDAVRLLAFAELIELHHPTQIIFVSRDKVLVASIKKLCQLLRIDFKWKQSKKNQNRNSLWWHAYHSLPHPMQAAVYLIKFLYQRKLLRFRKKQPQVTAEFDVTFVDYLINLDAHALKTKRFSSNYWTLLMKFFSENSLHINWIHHFVFSEEIPTINKARDLITQFTQNSDNLESHTLFDESINFSVVFSALCDYFLLSWQSIRLQKIKALFQPVDTSLNLWPLFKQDWLKSMRGSVAMSNCLLLNLIEHTVRKFPRQRLGVYLQENQAWEMAFIYAWKMCGHGSLIGVQHATVRYWDLRYFYDPRSYGQRSTNNLRMPDQVAVNGPVALKLYQDAGYPITQLIEVEALRYLYLNNKSIKINNESETLLTVRILVCGDLLPEVCHQMMLWLEAAAKLLPFNAEYILKSHPAYKINVNNYSKLPMKVTSLPLRDLLADCDVVFTSNITSAAVDAYCSGLPVIYVLDPCTFNLSPLRGLEKVTYVSNVEELVAALSKARSLKLTQIKSYFCLDNELSHWKKLLCKPASS
jgi:surface carbohydrate biosynthesis protein (TIGR04326 family)